jgi:glycosyltransferase involved in cell wall biosynthesis
MLTTSVRAIHIVSGIDEEAAGPSYSVVRTCESLRAEGHRASLATIGRANLGDGVNVFPPGFGPARLGPSPRLRQWLEAQAQSGTVDVLHNHGLWMLPNIYPSRVARRYGIPLLVSPRGMLSEWALRHGSPVKRLFWPLVQRPALSAVSCFHATAASEYDDVRRLGFRQPVAVIPNGIDIPDRANSFDGNKRSLLFLGRIHPKKGVDLLLQAWRQVSPRFPDWHLRVAGPDNGGYLFEMQALAQELELQRIEFSGPLFGEAKLAAYRDAELFVLPTHSENFGMTVAESLAAGTPAIVSRGAPWEGLVSQGAGWWIEIGVEPLIACLETALAQQRPFLQAMGQRGRSWMQTDFSWPHLARQLAETYRWILAGAARDQCPAWVHLD